jgi:transposase
MLSWSSNSPVHLCVTPIDLRKSFEGLGALVQSVFHRNLFDGELFLFINKRRDRIKALWWDRDGMVIVYKRLEHGCFEIPRDTSGHTHVTLDATALAMLLGGVPLSTPRRKRYARAS